jgi:hypothetical protein
MSNNIAETALRKANRVYTCTVNTIESVNPFRLTATRAWHMEKIEYT